MIQLLQPSIASNIYRWLCSLLAALLALVEPALNYLLLCTGFIMLDCYSAWRLARRVKAAHPARASGKFRSEKMRHIFITLAEVYAVVLLAYFAQTLLMTDFPIELPINLPKIVAAAVCGWQFWSYLENSASCTNAKWAKTARDILVDKTARHFDIALPHSPSSDTTSEP